LPTFAAPVLFVWCVLRVAVEPMKRLILTSSSGYTLSRAGLADLVITFSFRFAWGPLPSPDELAAFLGPRSKEQGSDYYWSGYVGGWSPAAKERRYLALVEFCEPYETIELWFDPDPNDQLQLIWLLDYFRAHPETAVKPFCALLTSI
jgi:hypothetical protein